MFNKVLKNHAPVRIWAGVHFIILAALLMVATACGGSPAEPEAAPEPAATATEVEAPAETTIKPASGEVPAGEGDTLSMFLWQAPNIVNPHLAPGVKDQFVSRITYEPLASFDAEGTIIPFLAAEIPSLDNGGVAPDGKSVTWKLRQDVKWSDGEPFTADDVLFTFEYLTNPDIGTSTSAQYSSIDSVEVIGDYRVKVNFKEVNPAWAIPFVGVKGMIIPRHVFESYNGPNYEAAPANLMAVGTGPYRVVEFINEDILLIGEDVVNTTRIIFEPNPFYRDPDKPFFSQVEVQGGGGDANFAGQVLLDGLVDYSWNVRVDEALMAQLAASQEINLVSWGSPFVERIMINFTDPNQETDAGERANIQFPHPFLTDLKVRQALALAIDREAIGEIYGRLGTPTSNLLVSPANYASPNTTYEYNPEKAAALLAEAGWVDSDGDGIRDKDGRALSILHQTSINAVRQQVQAVLEENLTAVGFDIRLKSIDSSIFFSSDTENTNTRNHFYADLEEFATSNKSPDPLAYLNLWTCDQRTQMENNWGLSNLSRYCNPDYEALYQQATVELDPDQRQGLIIQMNDLLIEDAAVIPLIHLKEFAAMDSKLVGLAATPWDVDTWNIADWRRK